MKRIIAATRPFIELLWWVLLLFFVYVILDSYFHFRRHHIAPVRPPSGTLTIPLQPDSSDLVPYIYNKCPFTIKVNDSIEAVIDSSETFVYVLNDSCWLEHRLVGHRYVHGKDSTRKEPLEVRDRQALHLKIN